MSDVSNGVFFSDELLKEIKDSFFYVDNDPTIGRRLFFDNAGGSFRLKKAVEQFAKIDAIPDCPERIHKMALYLQKIQDNGTDDVKIIFNAKGGSVFTSLTASQAMFDMVRAIAENVSGSNMITSVLEHPSAYDPMEYYAKKLGKELRVAKSNPITGGVDVDEVVKLVDKDTCILSVMYASNISGAIYDIENIVKKAREIKPDLYIIVDAVQHAPHDVIDLQKTPVDGINFAPYKFFGCRGSGIAWLSDRAAVLPHHKLIAKKAGEWELGSPAPAQFAVVTEIVNYVCFIGGKFISSSDRRELFACGMSHIALQERALMSTMLNGTDEITGLRNMRGVTVFLDYKDFTKKDFIVAMGFENLGYTQAVREYEKRGVIVYERINTSPYSKRMLESFNMDGAIRVSPLHCNSKADIDEFLKVTMELTTL
ncbi:aminotransferase class V-fold PLP-dependent enzyme [Pelosinus propionicus]|uniref:Selenocysteine lyase/Cysteine desulfurase n=1 Tax=Pelosinus propionicus DSM 13327 TaxID=1123291 RepID=A0A1I4JNX7_9FIRM|nr:aminotransferase class V-fold PLP-dependent enzyme [Pelosinus propionicus]SFL68001.1 Selenocysteine lyase/Cysteine desulfurase [Pelosinus propionicus DSM 13327]